MADLPGVLSQVLLPLGEMSLTAAYAAAVVAALRFLLRRRAPKQVLALLWLVVFARLLLPLSLPAHQSSPCPFPLLLQLRLLLPLSLSTHQSSPCPFPLLPRLPLLLPAHQRSPYPFPQLSQIQYQLPLPAQGLNPHLFPEHCPDLLLHSEARACLSAGCPQSQGKPWRPWGSCCPPGSLKEDSSFELHPSPAAFFPWAPSCRKPPCLPQVQCAPPADFHRRFPNLRYHSGYGTAS